MLLRRHYKMELSKAIKTRRSVRKFSGKKIPKETLLKILDAANNAPSACDIQGWRFIVITNPLIKKKIIENGAASFILNAPVGVLVLYNNMTDNVEYSDHIQSAAACIQNMLLAAHSFNIGCCWVCHLPPKNVLRKILRIPGFYDPIAYVAMGYYDIEPADRPRKHNVNEIVSYNLYNLREKAPLNKLKLGIKRFLRKIYFKIPFRKYIKPHVDKRFEKKFD